MQYQEELELIKNQVIYQGNPEDVILQQKKEVLYFTFPSLSKYSFIKHAFSTRLGGVSEGIFSSMNLSFTRGDEEHAVRQNFERIAEAIGVSAEDMVFSDQTHTTNVRVIKDEDRGNGITHPKSFLETDGMITNVPGLVLTTFYADCVPLYFVDPVKRVIGLSHSGWRGTVGRIGEKTIRLMQEVYQTKPEDVIAVIGPSICKDCYEISEDVAMRFREAFTEEECSQILFPHRMEAASETEQKYQLDLWQANQIVLLNAGIRKEHLTLPAICTCCNPTLLFSHRASKGKRGNLAAFLSLQ